MNILFYIDFPLKLHTGGVQRSTHKMALLFKKKGHKCFVLTREKKEKVRVVDGLYVISINDIGDSVSVQSYKKYLEEYNIDVVINQMGSDLYVTNFLFKHKSDKVRLLSTLRMNPKNFADNLQDILEVELQKRRIRFLNIGLIRQLVLGYHRLKNSYILKTIIKKSDYFILLNKNFIPELKYFGIDTQKYANKLIAIPNLFSPVGKQGSKKEYIILYVGRLNRKQKRTDLLMQIWKELHARLSNWKFIVIGDGDDKAWMQSYAEQHKLNRVKFLGFQDPKPYYKKAKILSFTSAYEGFGNVLVEAQQYGVVPVMFNSYSAGSDIVLDDISGFQIAPFNCDEFVHKTNLVATDEHLFERLSTGAIKQAENFEEEKVFSLWEEIISSNKI